MKDDFLPCSHLLSRGKELLLCWLIIMGTIFTLQAKVDWNVLTYEDYVLTGASGSTYFSYLESSLFFDLEAATPNAPPIAPEECPEGAESFDICDEFGQIVTNGIIYRGMIDKTKGSKPFCFIDGTDCFSLDGLNLHGRPKSDVFFDVYDYQHNADLDPCYFNFYFTEGTNTKRVKAFIFRCEMNEEGEMEVICEGDTETMTSIPVNCVGEQTQLAPFWKIVVAGIKWENYSFKIKPEGACSRDDIIPLVLEENESGNRTVTVQGSLKGQENDFVNCKRILELRGTGPGIFNNVGDDLPECAYDGCYPESGCSLFEGDDLIYSFTLEGGNNEVLITLENEDTDEPLGMFLYDFLCGEQCIDFAEIRGSEGGNFIFNESLASGVYYLIIDSDDPNGPGDFTLTIEAFPLDQIYVTGQDKNLDDCEEGIDYSADAYHRMLVRYDRNIEVDNRKLSEYRSDEFKIQFLIPINDDAGAGGILEEKDFAAINLYTKSWRDETLRFRLSEDLDNSAFDAKCGFIDPNDPIVMRVSFPPQNGNGGIRNRFIEPMFLRRTRSMPPNFMVGETDLTNNFQIGGDAVLPFDLDPNFNDDTFFGLSPNRFGFVSADGDEKEVRVTADADWRIINEVEIPGWITIDEDDFEGFGIDFINFSVAPNDEGDGTTTREANIAVVGPGGILDSIKITQLGACSFLPCVEISSMELNCDAPRVNISSLGCIENEGINSEWEINGEFFGSGTDIQPTLIAGINNVIELTITDQVTQCSTIIIDTIFVPEGGGPSGNVNVMEVTTCKGDKKGMFTLKIKDGTGPYSVQWSNGDTSLILNEVDPGEYRVTITDANGCQDIEKVDFGVDDHCPGGLIGEDMVACAEDPDPGLILNLRLPDGGGSPSDWNFYWKKSTNLCIEGAHPGSGNWEIIPGASGDSYDPGPISETTYYKRFATKKIGHVGDPYPSNVVCVSINNPITLSVNKNLRACEGEEVVLEAEASGGTPPFNYNWSNGATTATQTVILADTETFTIKATDAVGCSVEANVRVNIKPAPKVDIKVLNDLDLPIVCADESVTLEANISLGAEIVEWSTDGQGTLSSTMGPTVTYFSAAEDLSGEEIVNFFVTVKDVGNACDMVMGEISLFVLPTGDQLCDDVMEGFLSADNQGLRSAAHYTTTTNTAVEGQENLIPLEKLEFSQTLSGVKLYQNNPNPFDQSTEIGFEIPTKQFVEMHIQNAAGQIIKTIKGVFDQGFHSIKFVKGEFKSGLYYYTFEAKEQTLVRKMIILD